MDSGGRAKPEAIERVQGVAVETIGIMIGSAILGAAAALFTCRMLRGGTETVSTLALLSFFLMMGLAVAAIVLSLVAISLSRTAERALNENAAAISAVQSAAVLERLREELGRTRSGRYEMPAREVWIEDLTAAIDRALSIREQYKGAVPGEPDAGIAAAEQPEAALVDELPPAAVTDEMRAMADKKYGEFKNIVLLGVANYPGVISRNVGEAAYRTAGDGLVDGAFIINRERVAVCTFGTSRVVTDRFRGERPERFEAVLRALVHELRVGHFTRVFMVFDGKLVAGSPYAKSLSALSSRIDKSLFACFELFEGSPDIIIPELTERVSQLMELPPGADHELPEASFGR